MQQELNQQTLDAVAEATQGFRLENKPKITQQIAQEIATEPWAELTSTARDQIRLNVKAVIRALEANGYDIRSRTEEAGRGAGRT